MLRPLTGVYLCVYAALGALSAQQPVFRTRTQHVAIDVVVTDSRDRPVTDLTKEDFEIRENGTWQTITDFAFVSVPLANRVVDVDAPPMPPSDVGSNSASLRSSRAIVVFVDDTSLSAVLVCEVCVDVMVALKQALTRFLQSLSSDDQVAIVWQSRSDLSQDFTNDIPRLIASVNNRKAAMGPVPIDLRTPWRPRVDSLKFAVAALAGSNYARRAIVFVGTRVCNPVPGLSQASMTGFEDVECRDLYERARNANVPIYALDPRVNPETRDQTMAEVAINTGGRHFLQQSSPLQAVDQIVIENGSFYTLGFYPEPMVRDGKYHKLDVTVKRPGLRVRSRDRYLADTASPPPSTPKRDMTKALASGLDDPSLPIRAFVAPLAPGLRGMTRTLVTLELTYPVPTQNRAKLQDELRVGILALSPDAKIKASFQRPITLTGAWKPTASGTFVLNETIDLPSDDLTVRAGITSRALGRTGTAHIAIDVPDYRKRDLQMSPLVIGSARQSLDAAVGLDALRGLVPFQPTTGRAFQDTDRLRVFALVYAGSTAATFQAVLQLDDQPPLAETLSARHPTLGRREATLDTFVPLTGLAPGPHALTVTVTDGKQKAQRAIPFEIVRQVRPAALR